MKPIIEVENLSKRYRLGVINRRTFRDELKYHLLRLRGKEPGDSMRRIGSELKDPCDFWALKELSFTVAQGEVLGLIGGNGAGKSTLLKILTRITEPTAGRATLRGRVGSLLEVGTGFHPELTGRENIYMNGAILGMKRGEIAEKFDAIVDFSGVAQFIDTPVKRYSSGMYVRLAFAVAAHLEPEILLVDEVLAVGDVEFQRKCLGKMGDIAREGRTILFVSHNMQAVRDLCTRCIRLHEGVVLANGATDDVVSGYQSEKLTQSALFPATNAHEGVAILDVRLQFEGKDAVVVVEVSADDFSSPLGVTLSLRDSNDLLLSRVVDSRDRTMVSGLRGEGSFTIRLYDLLELLNPGTYFFDVGLTIPDRKWLISLPQVVHFNIPAPHNAEGLYKKSDGSGPLALKADCLIKG